jgi:hypothetical protein
MQDMVWTSNSGVHRCNWDGHMQILIHCDMINNATVMHAGVQQNFSGGIHAQYGELSQLQY